MQELGFPTASCVIYAPRRFHFFKSSSLVAYSDHRQAGRAELNTASKSRKKNHAFSHNMVATFLTSTNDPCRSTVLAPSDIQKFHLQKHQSNYAYYHHLSPTTINPRITTCHLPPRQQNDQLDHLNEGHTQAQEPR